MCGCVCVCACVVECVCASGWVRAHVQVCMCAHVRMHACLRAMIESPKPTLLSDKTGQGNSIPYRRAAPSPSLACPAPAGALALNACCRQLYVRTLPCILRWYQPEHQQLHTGLRLGHHSHIHKSNCHDIDSRDPRTRRLPTPCGLVSRSCCRASCYCGSFNECSPRRRRTGLPAKDCHLLNNNNAERKTRSNRR